MRFAGFGKEEDEWVSVKRAIRERSLPLEPSECDKINVGDLVLCFRVGPTDHLLSPRSSFSNAFSDVNFQENPDHALYCDAHVVEIERRTHGDDGCTCIFTVRYEHDNAEV